MDSHLTEWLNANESRFFESPRKKAFGRNPNGFTITSVDMDNKHVTVTFEGSQNPELLLKFSMFDRALEYMEATPHTVYPIGARPRPPYTKESIEGEIWRSPLLHPTEYRASPQILDILSLSGLVKYTYTNDRDTRRALEVTGRAFELLDMGDIKGAVMVLFREKGMRISRATNIIGLSDQENLCIYDNRVGYALRTLTYDMERLVKIPPHGKGRATRVSQGLSGPQTMSTWYG